MFARSGRVEPAGHRAYAVETFHDGGSAMTGLSNADWLAVEVHEARLQVWAMQGASVLESAISDGEAAEPGDLAAFDAALAKLAAPWQLPRLPVFVAGMPAGRTDAAPRMVPCSATAERTMAVATENFDLQVIPPLRQQTPSGLLQGAETRIAGFLSLNKDWDGVICLPGATSVWAQISAGEVVSFQTFLTGELLALLGDGPPPRARRWTTRPLTMHSAMGCRGLSVWRGGWPPSGPNWPCKTSRHPPQRRGWRVL
nr:2-dehydro-3-deoxygalactonokinase [Sulfitobacter faviae]